MKNQILGCSRPVNFSPIDRLGFAIPKDDIPLYATLGMLQILPPLAILDLPEPFDSARKIVSYSYFIATACLAVYLGAKRQDIKQTSSPISQKSALVAPIVSSVFLFGLYLLLKYTNIEIYFDKLYQVSGTLLGVTCIDVLVTSVIGTPLSDTQIAKELTVPENMREPQTSPVGLIVGSVLAVAYLSISIFGGRSVEALCALSFFNNIIAVSIAVFSIGIVRVESFAVACAFLSGLFFYDVFWVFGTDVMMTVATKVEAPVKFLFPAPPAVMLSRPYPYSVLGLGDVVVPGVMAGLARRIDQTGLFIASSNTTQDAPVATPAGSGRISLLRLFPEFPVKSTVVPTVIPSSVIDEKGVPSKYLPSALGGYSAGLLLAFAANEVTKAGQPALLYLVPCIISAMVLTAVKNDALQDLWGGGLRGDNKSLPL